MKLLTTAVLALAFTTANAEEKWLEFNLNESTFVRIANVKCPIKEISKKYPYGALAYNKKRKEYLFGCFTNDKDDVVIQWAGGDKSVFPANVFLMEKTL